MAEVKSEIKTINWRTNYNKKMDCPFFFHLDVAPPPDTVMTESMLEKRIIVINAMDSSHPPIRTKLFDITRFLLKNLQETFTLISHGMTKKEYLELLMQDKRINQDTVMALYHYKRID